MNDNTPPQEDPTLGRELAELLEHRRELLLVIGADGRLGSLSPAAGRWFGASAVGELLTDLAHPDDAPELVAALAQVTAGPSAVTELRCRLRDSSGEFRTLELHIADRRRRRGIGGLVCVARDTAETTDLTARLIHQATHDPLTSLPNRAALLDQLNDPVSVTPEGAASVAVLYVDLDGFKDVNDTLGHAAGDRVLVAVADRLRRVVRPGDMVARLGGDEFVIVAHSVTDGLVAMDIAQRIVAVASRPISAGGRLVEVSASVGVTIGRRDRAMELLDEADRAMYRSKRAGRNQCVLFTSDMRSPDDQRRQTEELLQSALAHDGLAVVFQPVVELGAGRLVGVEASLRLRDAGGGLLTPAGFLEIAEETGLVVPVGARLLDLACAQAARWQASLGDAAPRTLSVPSSTRQLADDTYADRVAATLDAHGLSPDGLCLELPESTLVDAGSAVARSLQTLKASGVRLAIDDFGSGRSSLAYLRRYSIDMLRIDRCFTTGLGHLEEDTEVVRAVVGLGEALGMTTLAKGVEHSEQAETLRQLGCQLGQGFYFGRPALPEDLDLSAGA